MESKGYNDLALFCTTFQFASTRHNKFGEVCLRLFAARLCVCMLLILFEETRGGGGYSQQPPATTKTEGEDNVLRWTQSEVFFSHWIRHKTDTV